MIKSDSSVSVAVVMCAQHVFLMMSFSVEENDLCLPKGEVFCLNTGNILKTTNGFVILILILNGFRKSEL